MEEKVNTLVRHIRRNVEFYISQHPGATEVSIANLDAIVGFDFETINLVKEELVGTRIAGKVVDDVFALDVDDEQGSSRRKVYVSW